jgi:hypothetical protein
MKMLLLLIANAAIVLTKNVGYGELCRINKQGTFSSENESLNCSPPSELKCKIFFDTSKEEGICVKASPHKGSVGCYHNSECESNTCTIMQNYSEDFKRKSTHLELEEFFKTLKVGKQMPGKCSGYVFGMNWDNPLVTEEQCLNICMKNGCSYFRYHKGDHSCLCKSLMKKEDVQAFIDKIGMALFEIKLGTHETINKSLPTNLVTIKKFINGSCSITKNTVGLFKIGINAEELTTPASCLNQRKNFINK